MSSPQFDPERITFFARTDARGQDVPFGIKAKDRTKHVYVIGKTGMGKSTMLENMAVQDIKNGEGMVFMDPHGATAEKLLEYIPEERIKDVLYFAPFDMEHPVAFNVMEDVGYDKRHLVVSGLMSTFKKIFVDAWSARMEYILSNTMLALLEYPGATLLGVNRMLSDKNYRDMIVANVKDPAVKSFWVDEFAKYNERYMQEAGDAIKNKIGQFTVNPVIRNIVGQEKSSFDIRQMMEERKILIINLSKGLVGETNANLLGSMFITRIYLAAMSRADMPQALMAKAPNFYLYVDEFQSFANETFANILSEARKYKLNLTIAHQYVEQMEEEVRNAVFGNVGTTMAFRVGPFDAEVLETVFAPQFTATDLVNLGFAQIYLTLMIDGIGSKPFSATTLPPIPQTEISHVDRVIAESRAHYSKPRAQVEELIRAWHEPVPSAPKLGSGASKRPVAAVVKDAPPRPALASAPSVPPTPAVTQSSPRPSRGDHGAHTPAPRAPRVEHVTRTRDARPRPVSASAMTATREAPDLRSILKSIAAETAAHDQKGEARKESNEASRSVTPVKSTPHNRGGRTPVPPRPPLEKMTSPKVDSKSELRELLKTMLPKHEEATADSHTEERPQAESIQPVSQPVSQIPASHSHERKELTPAELEKLLATSKYDRPPR